VDHRFAISLDALGSNDPFCAVVDYFLFGGHVGLRCFDDASCLTGKTDASPKIAKIAERNKISLYALRIRRQYAGGIISEGHMPKHPLLAEINAFLARHKMASTAFCRAAGKNANLYARLRDGKDIKHSTVLAVQKWMRAQDRKRPK